MKKLANLMLLYFLCAGLLLGCVSSPPPAEGIDTTESGTSAEEDLSVPTGEGSEQTKNDPTEELPFPSASELWEDLRIVMVEWGEITDRKITDEKQTDVFRIDDEHTLEDKVHVPVTYVEVKVNKIDPYAGSFTLYGEEEWDQIEALMVPECYLSEIKTGSRALVRLGYGLPNTDDSLTVCVFGGYLVYGELCITRSLYPIAEDGKIKMQDFETQDGISGWKDYIMPGTDRRLPNTFREWYLPFRMLNESVDSVYIRDGMTVEEWELYVSYIEEDIAKEKA